MEVQVVRANVSHEEGQKAWDSANYLIALGVKEYIEQGGDMSLLDKRKEMTFGEWYDYVRESKEKSKKNNEVIE